MKHVKSSRVVLIMWLLIFVGVLNFCEDSEHLPDVKDICVSSRYC